jgi:hypothetical protein
MMLNAVIGVISTDAVSAWHLFYHGCDGIVVILMAREVLGHGIESGPRLHFYRPKKCCGICVEDKSKDVPRFLRNACENVATTNVIIACCLVFPQVSLTGIVMQPCP